MKKIIGATTALLLSTAFASAQTGTQSPGQPGSYGTPPAGATSPADPTERDKNKTLMNKSPRDKNPMGTTGSGSDSRSPSDPTNPTIPPSYQSPQPPQPDDEPDRPESAK